MTPTLLLVRPPDKAWPAGLAARLLAHGFLVEEITPDDLAQRWALRPQAIAVARPALARRIHEQGGLVLAVGPGALSLAEFGAEAATTEDADEIAARARGLWIRRRRSVRTVVAASEVPRERPLVLHIEDDADTRDLMADILSTDHEILAAATGEAGLRLCLEHQPDLVLLDLTLPDRDGVSVLLQLHDDMRTRGIPVVVISGRSDTSTKVRTLALGAADFLEKPYSPEELLARLERTLALAAQHKQLRSLADTDALTGLPNLRAFRARLDEEVQRARRYGTPLACAMLDVDNLKALNDARGHATGNRALQVVSDVLREQRRATDFAARFGGDEFVLLLPHTRGAEAGALAERVRAALKERSAEQGVPLDASVGIAERQGVVEADALCAAADEALYAAKAAGRGCTKIA